MDEAPASSARVMPRAHAAWFRGLDKVFAPQKIFLWPFTPADFDAGDIQLSPVAEAPACPANPVSSESLLATLAPLDAYAGSRRPQPCPQDQ
jgi:hypothetical protein